jgi:two-component system, cell cycle response regulator DivK
VARILLVEDNELNRDMLSRRLQRRGHQVLLAFDGQEAVDQTLELQPDLVLMDIDLPVMNGWEAARILKGREQTACIPIIALTAHALVTDRERALEAGCDDYQSKPVDFPALLEKMESCIARRQVNGS